MRNCERCKEREAVFAVQYVGDDKPSVSLLGSHYRGFRVTRLCEECKDAILAEANKTNQTIPEVET